MFQRALRDSGILEELSVARERGLTAPMAGERTRVPRYAAELMLEAGLASGLCTCDDGEGPLRFAITPMGSYWLHDPLTRVNVDFNHHVCFEGAVKLREALLEGRPAGLPAIDPTGAATVYEALRSLAPEVKQAWFGFDHFYSDGVFEQCLPRVLSGASTLVDVGANTDHFSRRRARDPRRSARPARSGRRAAGCVHRSLHPAPGRCVEAHEPPARGRRRVLA
jgi:hypothetical protein